MKYLNRILSLLILVSATLVLTNCGGDDDAPSKSEQQTQFEKLKFTWTLQSVTATGDAASAAGQFDDGTLIISGNFTDNNDFAYSLSTPDVTASPWPGAGDLKFGTPVSSTLIRRDSKLNYTPALPDITMTYQLTNSDKTLTITLNDYSSEIFNPSGRVASVEGNWVFVFTRP